MPSITPPKSRAVAPAAGLTASLKDKARTRRESQRALVGAAAYAPARRNDLRPELRIHDVPIDSIKPAPRRVRRAEAAQAARLDASLARFGFVAPILVDAEHRIVHGHGIWEAARRAGLTEVPVIIISHLSDSEVRALRIALNRLAETGSWDESALRLEFQELIDLGEDVLATGFEPAEIDLILLDEEDAGEETADDDVPAPALTSTSRPGDLWRMGEHALLQGDARDPTSYTRLMEPGEQITRKSPN